jgi:formate dehydrogenase subunit gamma
MIERYTFRERMMHWITSLTYTYLLLTGLAFYSPHLFWLALVLGGGPTSRYWHPIVGLLFVAGTVWMHDIWRRDMEITETDKRWLKRTENYAKNRDELMPLQERFNAGQKLYYWLMVYGAMVLLLSGMFLWFPELVSFKVAWIRSLMIVTHEIAALVTIGGFIVHVYMSIFFVPGSMQAMIEGYVSRAWARAHHRLWYIRVTGGDAPAKE